jgi:hypothetical protein
MLGSFPGRQTQSIFYGELVVLDQPKHGVSHNPAIPAEFIENQKALLTNEPLWIMHGCFVLESNMTGAQLVCLWVHFHAFAGVFAGAWRRFSGRTHA